MNRPIIGTTLGTLNQQEGYKLNFEYAAGVEQAGGVPLAIPYRLDVSTVGDILDRLDGILFTGGDDLDPSLYGQPWHPSATPVDPARQRFEFALLAEAERRRLPTLCICLGCQVLNVYRGGSLHQFIPDLPGKLEHRKIGDRVPRHEVTLEPGSRVHQAIGKGRVLANSYHKQAVNTVGRGLVVAARAEDGIIEALEDPDWERMMAVQWHPERLIDEPEHRALFDMLVRCARRSMSVG